MTLEVFEGECTPAHSIMQSLPCCGRNSFGVLGDSLLHQCELCPYDVYVVYVTAHCDIFLQVLDHNHCNTLTWVALGSLACT